MPPSRESVPARPDSTLLAPLPVIVFASALPVPLMLATPVSIRFSMLRAEREVGHGFDGIGAAAAGLEDLIAVFTSTI